MEEERERGEERRKTEAERENRGEERQKKGEKKGKKEGEGREKERKRDTGKERGIIVVQGYRESRVDQDMPYLLIQHSVEPRRHSHRMTTVTAKYCGCQFREQGEMFHAK